MEMIFQTADGSHYASSPQSEKRDNRRVLSFAHQGCTSFLILRAPLNVKIDLQAPAVHRAINALADRLTSGWELQLPGAEQIWVRRITNNELYRDNDAVEIRDEAANYAVCGIWETEGEFRVLVPMNGMIYTTAVAVELRYTMQPYVITTRRWIFQTVEQQTDFYLVRFDKKSNYVDGMVYYTIGKSGYRFPVTQKMMGNSFLIKTNQEIPEFHSTNAGIILKKE